MRFNNNNSGTNSWEKVDCGSGLVVGILTFYSDDPSLNPASVLNFLYEMAKINVKVAGVGPSLKNPLV